MARDRTRSVHRIPALAICLPALGLPIVQISHRRGSLIPLPLSERREADHTIQQAVDRTIYTPHTSFHRLHKPYLLHAPSVEPRTADKHRPCQSPTGQRYKKSKGVYTSQLWHIHPFKVQLSKSSYYSVVVDEDSEVTIVTPLRYS